MKLKLLGTEIYVSFLFMAMLTLMIACDKTGFVLPTLFAVFIHELGHLFAMWALGISPKRIKLIPTSVQIVSDIASRYTSDIFVSLCGPIANFVLFIALYINFLSFKNEMSLCYGLLNLIIGIFNLFPVKGLDGGRILLSLTAKFFSLNKAELVLKIVTIIIAVAIIIVGILLAIKKELNLSIFIIGIYLLTMSLATK